MSEFRDKELRDTQYLDEELEAELRQKLRRVEASDGFADRVMERVARERRARVLAWPVRGRAGWIAIAAMLLVSVVLGGWQWRRREAREQMEADVARRQFEIAMQVAGRTLVEVQERIGHVGEIKTAEGKREVEQ